MFEINKNDIQTTKPNIILKIKKKLSIKCTERYLWDGIAIVDKSFWIMRHFLGAKNNIIARNTSPLSRLNNRNSLS